MLFNIDEVKTRLYKLVDRVLKGKRVVITRAGKPCIALTSHQECSEPRKPCRLRGQICCMMWV